MRTVLILDNDDFISVPGLFKDRVLQAVEKADLVIHAQPGMQPKPIKDRHCRIQSLLHRGLHPQREDHSQ
jgi:hypothetical protein